jgi:hypothetical protein
MLAKSGALSSLVTAHETSGHFMAYSLADPYRPLRLVMRVNGVLIGLALGALLLLASPGLLARIGLHLSGSLLEARLSGAALLGVGLFLLGNSSVREIDMAQLVPCVVFHALLALVLILAWFRGDLAALGLTGQIALLILFGLCLVGTLAPVRYFGAEYRF